jgi:hypothetical protein
MRPLITILLLLLSLCITTAYAGSRRNIELYDSGQKTEGGYPLYKHYTLLDLNECDDTGCVIFEHQTRDGLLYQWVDKTGNGVCNLIRVWKPLVDPTFGTYYTLHKYKLCRGTM